MWSIAAGFVRVHRWLATVEAAMVSGAGSAGHRNANPIMAIGTKADVTAFESQDGLTARQLFRVASEPDPAVVGQGLLFAVKVLVEHAGELFHLLLGEGDLQGVVLTEDDGGVDVRDFHEPEYDSRRPSARSTYPEGDRV